MDKFLIKNGMLWNGNGFSKKDVLFEGKHVTKIDDNIEVDTLRKFDASGLIVMPGLIDIHMHMRNVSIDAFGTDVSASCFPNGVTCAVDASAVSGDKEFLDTFAVKNAVFVHPTFNNGNYNFDNFEQYSKSYGDKLLGFKLFYDGDNFDGVTPLKEVCAFAKDKGLKVMVHTNNSPVSMMDIAKTLNKGDIITHAFHGGRNNAAEDNFECLKFAREKGIVIDTGFAGHVHTDFTVLKKAIDAKFYPDTISSDLTRASAFIRFGRYGLNYCMSIMRTLGMPDEEILLAVTKNAAKAVGKENEWGNLEIGCTDVTVLGLTDEKYSITDKQGKTVSDNKSYRTYLTVVNGDAVYSY